MYVIKARARRERTLLAIEEARLKVGCPVLLLANITFPARNGGDCPIPLTVRDTQALGAVELFNGAQGVVVGWATRDGPLRARQVRRVAASDTLASQGAVFHGVASTLRASSRSSKASKMILTHCAWRRRREEGTSTRLRPLVEERATRPVVVAPGTRDEYVKSRSATSDVAAATHLAWPSPGRRLRPCVHDVPVCRFGGDSEPEVVVLGEICLVRERPSGGASRGGGEQIITVSRLAWALSVHKSQGMGLEQVRFCAMGNFFDDGCGASRRARARRRWRGLSEQELLSPIQPRRTRA